MELLPYYIIHLEWLQHFHWSSVDHKTSTLFALGSGVCTCPLEFTSGYPLLFPSVSSLTLTFSILIRRLWVLLDAPFSKTFPSLFDIPSADILYQPVHFCSYTTNVTVYLSGLILEELVQEIATIGKYRLILNINSV